MPESVLEASRWGELQPKACDMQETAHLATERTSLPERFGPIKISCKNVGSHRGPNPAIARQALGSAFNAILT